MASIQDAEGTERTPLDRVQISSSIGLSEDGARHRMHVRVRCSGRHSRGDAVRTSLDRPAQGGRVDVHGSGGRERGARRNDRGRRARPATFGSVQPGWAQVQSMSDRGTRPARQVVVAIDPTHRRRTHLRYITTAIGRDSRDVALTCGVHTGPGSSGRRGPGRSCGWPRSADRRRHRPSRSRESAPRARFPRTTPPDRIIGEAVQRGASAHPPGRGRSRAASG